MTELEEEFGIVPPDPTEIPSDLIAKPPNSKSGTTLVGKSISIKSQ